MANRLLSLLHGVAAELGLRSSDGAWRRAVCEALGPWESSLPMPWPGDICTGPLLDGAVRSITPAGAVYPSQVSWSLGAVELLRVTYTRNVQGLVVSRVSDTAGSLVMTVTDTITYPRRAHNPHTRVRITPLQRRRLKVRPVFHTDSGMGSRSHRRHWGIH